MPKNFAEVNCSIVFLFASQVFTFINCFIILATFVEISDMIVGIYMFCDMIFGCDFFISVEFFFS